MQRSNALWNRNMLNIKNIKREKREIGRNQKYLLPLLGKTEKLKLKTENMKCKA